MECLILRRWKILLSHCLCLIATITTLPATNRWVATGGDESWILALNLSVGRLSHGADLLFTYGPLGFTCFPKLVLPVTVHLFALCLIFVVSYILFYALHAYLTQTISNIIARYMFFTVAVCFLPLQFVQDMFDMRLLIALLLLCSLRLYGKEVYPWISICIGFIAATGMLIKFGSGLMGLGVFALYLVFEAVRKRLRSIIECLLSFLIVLSLFWSLWSGPVSSLLGYFKSGLALSTYYSECMSLSNATELWPLQAVAIVILFALMLYTLCIRRWSVFSFILLSTPVLFYVFKHGWVRNNTINVVDAPVTFGIWCFLCMGQVLRSNVCVLRSSRCMFVPGVLFVLGITLLVAPVVHYRLGDEDRRVLAVGLDSAGAIAFVHDILNALHPRAREAELEANLEEVRAHLPLSDEWKATIGDATIDCLGLDFPLLYAYRLNWTPRPSIMDYQSWLPYLDTIDATFVAKKGPKYFFIWRLGVDDRNPHWGAPNLVQAIRRHCILIDEDNGRLLLRRRDVPVEFELQEVLRIQASPGQFVDVPQVEKGGAELYVKLDWDLSLMGRIKRTLYRACPIILRFSIQARRCSRMG